MELPKSYFYLGWQYQVLIGFLTVYHGINWRYKIMWISISQTIGNMQLCIKYDYCWVKFCSIFIISCWPCQKVQMVCYVLEHYLLKRLIFTNMAAIFILFWYCYFYTTLVFWYMLFHILHITLQSILFKNFQIVFQLEQTFNCWCCAFNLYWTFVFIFILNKLKLNLFTSASFPLDVCSSSKTIWNIFKQNAVGPFGVFDMVNMK